jgi:hypothetical protein
MPNENPSRRPTDRNNGVKKAKSALEGAYLLGDLAEAVSANFSH